METPNPEVSRNTVGFDLTALEQALIVLDHGSFRRAAQALGVRPSVVSRRVQALEDAIGVSLFHRQSQGARPTVAGQRILNRGRAILDDVQNLLQAATLSGSGLEGRLCIGIVASVAGGKARELLQAFVTAHPRVELEIIDGSVRDHIASVRALRTDVALVAGSLFAPGCEVDALWSQQICAALPSNHPLAESEIVRWEELADERFIVTKVEPGPDVHDFVVTHLANLGRHLAVEPRSVGREGLMAMVALRLGVSLVCTADAGVIYPGVVFRPILTETVPFSAVWSPNNDNPPLRRFLSLARVHVREQARLATTTPIAAPLRMLDPSP